MLTHPTIDKLHALHLTAMATAFDQQRSASQYAELGFDDRFGLLVDTEWTARQQRRLTQRLRNAKLDSRSRQSLDHRPDRDRQIVVGVGLHPQRVSPWLHGHLRPGPAAVCQASDHPGAQHLNPATQPSRSAPRPPLWYRSLTPTKPPEIGAARRGFHLSMFHGVACLS